MATPIKLNKDLPNQTRLTTWEFVWEWFLDGVAYDFTGVTITFAMTKTLGGALAVQLSNGFGITVSGNDLTFNVQPADTNIEAGTYFYDLRFAKVGENYVYTKGTIIIEQNVTV